MNSQREYSEDGSRHNIGIHSGGRVTAEWQGGSYFYHSLLPNKMTNVPRAGNPLPSTITDPAGVPSWKSLSVATRLK